MTPEAFAKLLRQVEALVHESGRPDGFDAAAWLQRWLPEPLPAFGGARPMDLLNSPEGEDRVATILARMQSGALS